MKQRITPAMKRRFVRRKLAVAYQIDRSCAQPSEAHDRQTKTKTNPKARRLCRGLEVEPFKFTVSV
jgi:hypothetical protein